MLYSIKIVVFASLFGLEKNLALDAVNFARNEGEYICIIIFAVHPSCLCANVKWVLVVGGRKMDGEQLFHRFWRNDVQTSLRRYAVLKAR